MVGCDDGLMQRVVRVIGVGVVLAALALVAGCGGDGDADSVAPVAAKSTTTRPPATSKPASTCASSTAPTTVVYKTVVGVAPNLLTLDIYPPAPACAAPVV